MDWHGFSYINRFNCIRFKLWTHGAVKVKWTDEDFRLTGKESDQYLYNVEDGRIDKSFSYLCTQGCYFNYRKEFKIKDNYWRIWIGTKIYPSSLFKAPDYQKFGIGTTIQFKKLK